jgi:hypothetical protein
MSDSPKKVQLKKKESSERLKNQLEQIKLNISESSKIGDEVLVKYYQKQKTMLERILKRVLDN